MNCVKKAQSESVSLKYGLHHVISNVLGRALVSRGVLLHSALGLALFDRQGQGSSLTDLVRCLNSSRCTRDTHDVSRMTQ